MTGICCDGLVGTLMAAIVAAQYNPHVKALYTRLCAKGKSKMAALGAAPQPGTPKALAELIESTTNRMRKVIVEAKIRAE